jgi:hypothetical protein
MPAHVEKRAACAVDAASARSKAQAARKNAFLKYT